MQQKYLIFILIGILTLGIGIAAVNKFKEGPEASIPSPTPTPGENLLFNSGNSQSNQKSGSISTQTSNQEEFQPSVQPNQKTMKQYPKFPGILPPREITNKKAVIETNKGKIEFEIYPEASSAASNFIFLANDNFYNNLTFHRVVSGFVIQGGDPKGDGTGGPGYKFADEPVTKKYDKGIVAMANSGPDTNGSQFFIMLEDTPNLPPNYTIFGKVILGQEVVDQIKVGDLMKKVTIVDLKSGNPQP